ncbi:DUF6479 family protein [Streptomyces sp. NPDC051219]|uniref:DUF6479 family protein n=1 Tax=Streptomyces sp. NPDC051219 TaxID=3155283 RepID=UPI003439E235
MNLLSWQDSRTLPASLAAEGERDLLVGIAPFIVGLVVVALLIGLVWWGIRRRHDAPSRSKERGQRREPARQQGRELEPDEFPPDGQRLHPHEMKGFGNLGDQAQPEDKDGRGGPDKSGGAFGSGGPGG